MISGAVPTSAVKAALHLRHPQPTTVASLTLTGAGGAADRAVALGEQRVDDHVVVGDVALDIVDRPTRERVDLDHVVLVVPLDDLDLAAGLGLIAADARCPRDIWRQR